MTVLVIVGSIRLPRFPLTSSDAKGHSMAGWAETMLVSFFVLVIGVCAVSLLIAFTRNLRSPYTISGIYQMSHLVPRVFGFPGFWAQFRLTISSWLHNGSALFLSDFVMAKSYLVPYATG